MAITVTEGTPNTTGAGTFDVAIPAHSAGDLLVLMVAKNQATSNTPTVSTAGWTTEARIPNASATNHCLIAWKQGDGTESTVRVTEMSGGTLIGKVYRVQGAESVIPEVGTTDTEQSGATGTSSSALDVGTAEAGQVGFSVIAWASTVSAPSVSNGYTLDESTTTYGLAYKVLDSADDSTTWTWTSSRNWRTILFVARQSQSGTIAVTLDDATSSASGGHGVSGTVAATLDDATMVASGTHSIAGTIAVTLDDATVSASGEHASGSTGTIAVTLTDAAMEASGIHSTVGTIAVTLDDATGSASGAHTTVGSIAVTLDDATMAASGAITYTGTIAATLDDATMTASGGPELAGQITTTTDDATMAAYGDVVDLQAIIRIYREADRGFGLGVKRRLVPRTRSTQVAGSIAVTLADATMSATVAHAVGGTITTVLDDAVSSGDGTVGVVGAGTFVTAEAAMAASGDAHPAGTIAVTLDDATMTSTGAPGIAGTIAVTIADAEMSTAGWAAVTGTIAAIVDEAVASAAGGHGVSGTVATTLAGATMAAVGSAGAAGAGLDLAGTASEYAWTAHATALNATTALDVITFVALDDWTLTRSQVFASKWLATGNQRGWDLGVNSGGTLVFNLSSNGSTISALTGAPGSPFVDGSAGYWIRATWQSSDGATALYTVAAASASTAKPTSWGAPVSTGTRLAGQSLFASAADLLVGAINGGASLNAGGLVRYLSVAGTVGGAPFYEVDMRLYPDGATSFTDTVSGRTLTVVRSSTDAPVGMPNGEAANVGPTAAVLGHTPISYNDLPTQQLTKVITTTIANAQPTATVTSDGVTRRVFSLMNVGVAVNVTSTTPILIKDSKIGQIYAQAGANVWIEWTDIGFGIAKAGDHPLTPSVIYDGSETTNPTSACWNNATSIGAGADTITVDNGALTDTCLKVNAGSTAAKIYAYRCNLWGHTDASFTGGLVPSTLDSLAELTLVECWWHDYLWFPRDGARIGQTPNNSHCDGTKVNAGALLKWVRCRVDMWPVLHTDLAALTGPAWKGPHWGKNPNNLATWPLRRRDGTYDNQVFVATAFIIANQAAGRSKNVLVEDCILDGPIGNWYQFNKGVPNEFHRTITIKGNSHNNGVTQAVGTPWVQPRNGYIAAPNGWPAANKFHWPITGTEVNTNEDGDPITTHFKTGWIDSTDFTPV